MDPMGNVLIIPKDPFVCPENAGFPRSNPMTGDGIFRPSILRLREGSGFLGITWRIIPLCKLLITIIVNKFPK